MSPDRPILLVLAVVGLFVLVAGAANIADPVVVEDSTSGFLDRIGSDVDHERTPSGPTNETTSGDSGIIEEISLQVGYDICIEEISGLTPLLVFFTFIIAGGILLAQFRPWVLSLAFVTVLIPLTILSHLILTAGCGYTDDGDGGISMDGPLDEILVPVQESTAQVTAVTTDPLVIFLALIGVGLVAIVLVTMRDDFAKSGDLDLANHQDAPADQTAIATIAGQAADRLETGTIDVEADNEIYRAWLEMTSHLEIASPETSTPGEFAQAAIDAGMEPNDVNALTRLFEDVRYGDQPVTDDRERAAIDVLRRIEQSYGATDG